MCEFPQDFFSSDDCSGIADVSVVSEKGSFTSQKDTMKGQVAGINPASCSLSVTPLIRGPVLLHDNDKGHPLLVKTHH